MRPTAASRSSLDALDQWGIEFPLLAAELGRPLRQSARSRVKVILSARLAFATWRPAGDDDALDQWGIEFPIADGEFAALAGYRRERLQVRSSVLGDRLRGFSKAGAMAAILAVVVAGSALAVDPSASAGAVPQGSTPAIDLPVAFGTAASTQIASLTPATEQPTISLSPTAEPTPDANASAEAVASTPSPTLAPSPAIAAAVAPQARPSQVAVLTVPTIQDAKNYLVARLGAQIDRSWGMAESKCAGLIFEYEAQWNPHATNKVSGAYGLPQAKPASKLGDWAIAKAAAAAKTGDTRTAWLYRAWRDNPVVQAEWGVDYMVGRYGSPCAALAFRSGYWDDNGVFVPGVGWY